MNRSLLDRLLGREEAPAKAARVPVRLSAPERPALLYAIGDVHGCLDQLRDLEAQIMADASGVGGEKWLVMLGDYVDRGPRSAQVLDHLLTAPPPGFERICLRGNHEATMLQAVSDPGVIEHWLTYGGDATLQSYGLDRAQIELVRRGPARSRLQMLAAHLPEEHLEFLRGLPVLLSVPGFVFVHAGLRPGLSLDEQDEKDLIWIRDDFLEAGHDFGAVIVHGHTPSSLPFVSAHRIGIDTGCFMSGRLTALRIDATGKTSLLQTGPSHAIGD